MLLWTFAVSKREACGLEILVPAWFEKGLYITNILNVLLLWGLVIFCDYSVTSKKTYSITWGPGDLVCSLITGFISLSISPHLGYMLAWSHSPLQEPPHGREGLPISHCLYLNVSLLIFENIQPKKKEIVRVSGGNVR